MDPDEYNMYKLQLEQIDQALVSCPMGEEREELLLLKSNIEELLSLSSSEEAPSDTSCSKDPLSNEFALFMAEMEKEGAVEKSNDYSTSDNLDKLKDIEGMKCRAPHTHQWGHVAYHNAMVCSVVSENVTDVNEIKVRVLFINPTHQEMLPCPYYYESDCKFPDDKCRFSHGEIVLYTSLQEYIEPKFDLLTTGSPVLAKQSNNLWYRAIIRKIYDEKCVVKFESHRKEVEVFLEHVFPLSNDENVVNEYESSEDERREEDRNEDVINMSLMITPSKEALGNWEQFTKGIGSKLMQKMGYIVGTGLGKNSDGRLDPVTAVILPSGKSLDHCMRLREEAGDDKDLFSVERKLKKLQRRQEIQSRKHYERESQKSNSDVFNFINQTLAEGSNQNHKDRLDERQKLKKECSRSLNIKSLQIADNIRRIERDLEKLKDSLGRHTDSSSDIHLKLKDKLVYRQDQLKMYQAQAAMIRNEQSLRSDKKKMTVF